MASPIRMTGMTSGLDTESIVKALVSNHSNKVDKLKKQKTKNEWKQEQYKEINKEVYGLYTSISNLRFTSAYNLKKSTVSDATKATVSTSNIAAQGTHTLEVLELARAAYWTGNKVKAISTGNNASGKVTEATALVQLMRNDPEKGFTLGDTFAGTGYLKVKVGDEEKTLELKGDTTLSSLKSQLGEMGIIMNIDEGNERIYLSSEKGGAKHNFTIEAVDENGNADTSGNSYKLMEVLGLNISDNNKVLGTDAKIKLDKVEYTSETNSFTVNGLTVNALAKTGGEVTITTSADVQGLYDKIKDFIEQYNKVINDLTARYNADTAKGMEPLTDEEKEAMGESTANKYEDKIKASLMRRDGKVDGVISAMTRAMSASYEINGKRFSLSSFGINTLGILRSEKNEQNAYHIDGDADDDTVSGNTDKLMKALSDDPDTIVDFLKQLTTGLYKGLDEKMKKTTLSSAYTMYDDVSLKNENDELANLIKQWEKKVEDEEDRYYKKFASMESALTKLNGQQSSLSGLFNN